jgi:hypothetical protein
VTIVLWGLSKTVADRALAVDSVLNGGGGDVANGRLPGDEDRADNHVERARCVVCEVCSGEREGECKRQVKLSRKSRRSVARLL